MPEEADNSSGYFSAFIWLRGENKICEHPGVPRQGVGHTLGNSLPGSRMLSVFLWARPIWTVVRFTVVLRVFGFFSEEVLGTPLEAENYIHERISYRMINIDRDLVLKKKYNDNIFVCTHNTVWKYTHQHY